MKKQNIFLMIQKQVNRNNKTVDLTEEQIEKIQKNFARYGKGGWQGLLNASYYVTGLDSAGTHFGQNLLQSTFDSPLGNGNIPVQYYGNHVGQGIKHNILQVNAELRKSFHVLNNAFVWRIGALYRIDKTSFENKSDKYIYTGLFLNINPDHWNMR